MLTYAHIFRNEYMDCCVQHKLSVQYISGTLKKNSLFDPNYALSTLKPPSLYYESCLPTDRNTLVLKICINTHFSIHKVRQHF